MIKFTPHASHIGLPTDIPPGHHLHAKIKGKTFLVKHMARVGKDFKVKMADGSNAIISHKDIAPAPQQPRRVKILHPQGHIGTIPADQVDEAKKAGYKPL